MSDAAVLRIVQAVYIALAVIGFVVPVYVVARIATLQDDVWLLHESATLLVATTQTQLVVALATAWFSGAAGLFMAAWAAVSLREKP